MRLRQLMAGLFTLVLACGNAPVEPKEGEASGGSGRQGAPLQLVQAPPQLPVEGAGAARSLAPLVQAVRPTVVGVTTRVTARQVEQVPPGTMEDFWERFFGGEGMPYEGFPPSPHGGPGEGMGLGSGVIIDAQGIVLTNNHVVEGADEVLVRTSDEKEYQADVIGRDPDTDLAVLRLKDVRQPLPAASLGSSDTLRVGDPVVAIGNPFGLEFTVTSGIVSAKARVIGAGPFDDFLQTDAAINPGNSGGPLFDLQGNVVGLNTAIVAGGTGIGFAVPIDLVKALLPQLVERGEVVRGYLGVGIQDLTEELARALGVRANEGALVSTVEPGGPAARAGVRPGDVVVSVEGQPVESASQLSRLVSQLEPGRRINLELRRDGRAQRVTVELGQRPARPGMEERGPQRRPEPGPLGLALGPVPPEQARALGIQGGARVAQVRPGSPAARAGLRPGDVIVEANRRPVAGPEEFATIARESRGEQLLVRVLREGGGAYVIIPPAGERPRR